MVDQATTSAEPRKRQMKKRVVEAVMIRCPSCNGTKSKARRSLGDLQERECDQCKNRFLVRFT